MFWSNIRLEFRDKKWDQESCCKKLLHKDFKNPENTTRLRISSRGPSNIWNETWTYWVTIITAVHDDVDASI